MVAIIVYILIGIVLLAISVVVGTIRGEIYNGETLIMWVLLSACVMAVWPLAVILGMLCMFCYVIYKLIDRAKEMLKNE